MTPAKYIRHILLIILSLTLLTGCGQNTSSTNAPKDGKPVLRVGMDAAYPPFGSIDETTKDYVGFDVDIIRAIGETEGFDIEIKNLAFDGLIPALQSKSIDVAINDITVTDDRSKNVDFSRPYYIAGLGAVIAKDNTTIRTEKDLDGKRLGVSIGSTGEEAARKIPDADIHVFNAINEAFLELHNGGIDAVINDIPTNAYYVAHAKNENVRVADLALTKEYLTIAVAKGNSALLRQIDSGLLKIKENGEFTKIYKKYFGEEPPAELLK